MSETHTPLEDYLSYLKGYDIPFLFSEKFHRQPDHEGPLLIHRPSPLKHLLNSGKTLIEHHNSQRGIGADHATLAVADTLEKMVHLDGKTVVDVGCGSGFLATLAAMHGARSTGTDIDSHAVELAQKTAAANQQNATFLHGSLCDPISDDCFVDLFIANLPHKPTEHKHFISLVHDGGKTGTSLFEKALPQFTQRQQPGGKLLFFMHSLPHPALLKEISRSYQLEAQSWKLRWKDEREPQDQWNFYCERHKKGTSFLHNNAGRYALVCCVWLCTRLNK